MECLGRGAMISLESRSRLQSGSGIKGFPFLLGYVESVQTLEYPALIDRCEARGCPKMTCLREGKRYDVVRAGG